MPNTPKLNQRAPNNNPAAEKYHYQDHNRAKPAEAAIHKWIPVPGKPKEEPPALTQSDRQPDKQTDNPPQHLTINPPVSPLDNPTTVLNCTQNVNIFVKHSPIHKHLTPLPLEFFPGLKLLYEADKDKTKFIFSKFSITNSPLQPAPPLENTELTNAETSSTPPWTPPRPDAHVDEHLDEHLDLVITAPEDTSLNNSLTSPSPGPRGETPTPGARDALKDPQEPEPQNKDKGRMLEFTSPEKQDPDKSAKHATIKADKQPDSASSTNPNQLSESTKDPLPATRPNTDSSSTVPCPMRSGSPKRRTTPRTPNLLAALNYRLAQIDFSPLTKAASTAFSYIQHPVGLAALLSSTFTVASALPPIEGLMTTGLIKLASVLPWQFSTAPLGLAVSILAPGSMILGGVALGIGALYTGYQTYKFWKNPPKRTQQSVLDDEKYLDDQNIEHTLRRSLTGAYASSLLSAGILTYIHQVPTTTIYATLQTTALISSGVGLGLATIVGISMGSLALYRWLRPPTPVSQPRDPLSTPVQDRQTIVRESEESYARL